MRRIALKPEAVRKANAEKEALRLAQDARAALKVTKKDFAALLGISLRTLDVGAHADHPALCGRCIVAVSIY